MSDELTHEERWCPDCAGERGGWSSSTEKCQHHKTVDVISTLTKDLATSRRACEESGLAYETLVEEADALRLALETATRELTASRADVDAMQAYGQEQRDRAVAAERERDEIFAAASKIELSKRVVELERDLRLNASMLAKQCDMARVAEMAQTAAERERDDNANVILEQNKLWADRCEVAERERDEAREACRDEAWEARNVSAALDRFTASAREAMRECIGRDMEIAAAKALSQFWREIGVDE